MLIRPAQNKDLPTCAKIFSIPEVQEANGEYLTSGFLANYLDQKYFLVVVVDGQVRGALFGEPLRGRGVVLHNFAVAGGYRNKGLGGAMLKQFETNARRDKREWILIYAPLANERTLNFYKKRAYFKDAKLLEYLKLINNPNRELIFQSK